MSIQTFECQDFVYFACFVQSCLCNSYNPRICTNGYMELPPGSIHSTSSNKLIFYNCILSYDLVRLNSESWFQILQRHQFLVWKHWGFTQESTRQPPFNSLILDDCHIHSSYKARHRQGQQQNNHSKALSIYSFCNCIIFKWVEDHFLKHFVRFPFKLLFVLKLLEFRIFVLNAFSSENTNWVFVLQIRLGFRSYLFKVLSFCLTFEFD